jgi:NADP-reducing hydrogenase subunit HndB
MPRLTIDDLKKMKEESARTMNLRSGASRAKVTIHMGTCGISAGARDVMAALMKEIDVRGIADVIVTTSGCAGLCSREPMATVEIRQQAPVKYGDLDAKKIVRILEEHVLKGQAVSAFALGSGCETTG